MTGIYNFCKYNEYGCVCGTFEEEVEVVNFAIKHNLYAYFGEVMGENSSIEICLSEADIRLITQEPDEVEKLKSRGIINGFNIFDQWAEDEEGWNIPVKREGQKYPSYLTLHEYVLQLLNGGKTFN